MPQTVKMEVGPLSIAANARNANVFNDKQYQTAPFDGELDFLVTGSAQGLEAGLFVAGELISEEENINTQNRAPLPPDDLVVGGVVVMAGDPIAVPVRNTTGGALNVFARVVFTSFDEELGVEF